MRKAGVKKIVVLGPESTGKSTLCKELAQHYGTSWCPEFAREYLLANGKEYNYDDLLAIAKGQLALEDEFIGSIGNLSTGALEQLVISKDSPSIFHYSPLFIDTDMYVMKVWCEFVFDKCHRFILDSIVERNYDLYLLCNIDLPWTKDELREYPDLETRKKIYNIYEDLMINQSVPWVDISGNHELRLKKAIDAVDALLREA